MHVISRHRKAQIVITVAVALAVGAHYVMELFLPEYKAFAPLAGAFASLVWIWIE